MKKITKQELKDINAGLGLGKLIGSIAIGAITGALRGIPAGPAGIVGSAIFGAGMGAATCAITDAGSLYDEK